MAIPVKLSRLCLYVYLLQASHLLVSSLDWCISTDVSGHVNYGSLCDSEFCRCNNPIGQVECSCLSRTTSQVIPEIHLSKDGRCRLPEFTTALTIANCQNVTFQSFSLQGLYTLRTVNIVNVRHLRAQANAFHWNESYLQSPPLFGVSFNFTHVTIPELPSYVFKGRIEKILFANDYIGVIRTFAFTSMSKLESLTFKNTNIANAEPQSFKKLTIDDFQVDTCQFNVIPSRFLVDIDIPHQFEIKNSMIDTIRTIGFGISGPVDMVITGTRINNIDGEAFKIYTKGKVVITDCSIHNIESFAFKGIKIERHSSHKRRPVFEFINNTIGYLKPNSLDIDPGFHLELSKLYMDEPCTCEDLEEWNLGLIMYLDEPLTAYLCHPDDTKELSFDYISASSYYNSTCLSESNNLIYFILVIVIICIGVIALIISVVCYLKRRGKWKQVPTNSEAKNGSVKTSPLKESDVIRPQSDVKALIVPDGRTYKETEFQIVIEKAEPLHLITPRTIVGKPVLNSDL